MPEIALFPVVAAALLDEHGRVLIQRRPAGTALAGLWEFPGGKVEAGESPEQALIRELDEELGIAVAVDSLVPVAFASHRLDARRHMILLLFRCRDWRGAPRALAAAELRWSPVADLHGFAMPPADDVLVAALARSM